MIPTNLYKNHAMARRAHIMYFYALYCIIQSCHVALVRADNPYIDGGRHLTANVAAVRPRPHRTRVRINTAAQQEMEEANAQTIADKSNKPRFLELKGTLKPCSSDGFRSFAKVMYPTVPRSGSGILRKHLEYATGVITEAVYEEGPKNSWSNRSHAYGHACGIHGQFCGKVRRSNGAEPVIVKTHYPFMGPELRGRPDCSECSPEVRAGDCVSAIVMSIRHPLDNFIAHVSFKTGNAYNFSGPYDVAITEMREHSSFSDFYDLWEQHHTFWHAYAAKHGIPLLQFRYEDLCANPELVKQSVLSFLKVAPLKDRDPLSSIYKANDCMLRNVRKYPQAAALVTQSELDSMATRSGYLMKTFGYQRRVNIMGDFFKLNVVAKS